MMLRMSVIWKTCEQGLNEGLSIKEEIDIEEIPFES